MKLFIASPIILDNYASIQEDFQGIIEGRWVEEHNLHLTWVFLRKIEDESTIIEKLKALSPLEAPIAIKELGYFGRPPKIFFARSEEKSVYEKAREFKNSDFEIYRFKPHITLCRIQRIHDYKAYKERLKTYRERSLGLILPEVNLYESRPSAKGVQYSCRYSIKA